MKEILWTIQHQEAYKEFERTGILRASDEHLLFEGYFRSAYEWMVEQMKKRISEPPEGVRYPVWAWYQWEGKRKRMDLRYKGYAKRGTPLVQITFEANPKNFLLSDFDEWHGVMGGSYCAKNEQDWNDFCKNDGEERRDLIVASWDRIFDITTYTPDWNYPPEEKSIQATLWEIHISQVKKVEYFIAK